MEPQCREAELLSADGKCRLAIYRRPDNLYHIVEERVRSYEAGDEYHPDYVPFPRDATWEPYWQLDAQPRAGVFGEVGDAVKEARLLLAKGD